MRRVLDNHLILFTFCSSLRNRYLTKICDQVVALLSPEYSASLVWNDGDNDTESVDTDTGESDRVFTYEVAETNGEEESAAVRPGFQVPFLFTSHNLASDVSKMNLPRIPSYETPPDSQVDPSVLTPRLLPGETTQGFLTATYIPPQTQREIFDAHHFNRVFLRQLL
jgi:hypothetical protein